KQRFPDRPAVRGRPMTGRFARTNAPSAGRRPPTSRSRTPTTSTTARATSRTCPGSTGPPASPRAAIEQIKPHLFHELHPLEADRGGTVLSRSDPSPDIAEAWLRLRAGRHRPEDLALLEHELAESRYWQQHPNAPLCRGAPGGQRDGTMGNAGAAARQRGL